MCLAKETTATLQQINSIITIRTLSKTVFMRFDIVYFKRGRVFIKDARALQCLKLEINSCISSGNIIHFAETSTGAIKEGFVWF